MNENKGKRVKRASMYLLKSHSQCWDVWSMLFAELQSKICKQGINVGLLSNKHAASGKEFTRKYVISSKLFFSYFESQCLWDRDNKIKCDAFHLSN